MDHKRPTSCYRHRTSTSHARSAMAIIQVQREPKVVDLCEMVRLSVGDASGL